VDGASVKFAATLPMRATFDGKLSADGATLSGKAANADGDVAFQLARAGEAHVKVPLASSMLPKQFEGYWEGAIESNGRTRRVGLKLAPGPAGVAVATFFAVDQNNMEIPVSSAIIKDKQLELDARAISGTYKGTLDGDQISGELIQAGATLTLNLKKK
jgi:hypothetical protein